MTTAPDTKRRTKIAVVIGTLEVGGAELDIVRNFPRLNRDEFEVVVVLFRAPGTLAPELERQGVRVIVRQPHLSESASASGVLGALREVRRILRTVRWVGETIRDERVDIAHFFLPHSYVYGMLACMLWRPKTKTVMSRLSLNFYRKSQWMIAWLERTFLHRRVDIAIGNAGVILAELADEGVDPLKLRLVHNGVDPLQFAPHAESRAGARRRLGVDVGAFTIVALGNLHAYKGHGDLIAACKIAEKLLPRGWRLLVAGRDMEGNRVRYESLVAQHEMGDHIRFLGECAEPIVVLHAGDVFVHPSHHEGLPNAIIEAMAASLPVVATDVGGISEAVVASPEGELVADETGWLVPPHDPDALAAALLDAAEDPVRRALMGEAASQRVREHFSIDAAVASYTAVYRELKGRDGGR